MPANILFITCDQLRRDTLGCYGDPIVQTPHIDALAEGGVRFTQTYTAYPVCGPNRGSLVTGRYPTVHGLTHNGVILPQREMTMMEALRRRGYATYGVGKTHFGPQWRFPPDGGPLVDPTPDLAVNPQPEGWELPWYGFERVLITEDHKIGPYEDYLNCHGYSIWDDPHSFSYPQHQCVRSAYPVEHHQTTWIGDRAVEFLEQHPPEQPFFLWASFVHPHHPFTPPAPYDTMYDPADMPAPRWLAGEAESWPEAYRRKHYARRQGVLGGHEDIGMDAISDDEWRRVRAFYYGMITLIDVQVGRLMETLRRQGMLEETVIVFTSDHGEMLGDHHLVFKGTTFDEVTGVPLIVTRPGEAQAGAQRDLLTNSIDIMPTILDAVGVPIPAGVQGVSLLPALDDATLTVRDATLIENVGVRRSVRTHDALLTWHGYGQLGELYDLRRDPHCHVNLWDDPALSTTALKAQMLDRLIALLAENVDPLPPRVGAC
jgi:arylsulfatase